MREDLLHFIWKYKKLQLVDLFTTKNQPLNIVDVGTHNHLSGPDFFNAKVSIDGQLWAGNVEIHLKSSDWYVHNHEKDVNYNNVILHVIWEDDGAVFRSDNSEIPALELKRFISQEILDAYQNLLDKRGVTFINCENDLGQVDTFLVDNWLERLYFERLERKSEEVNGLLEETKNDWEKVLFTLLLKNFGSKINGEAFLSLGRALDFSVVRKLQCDINALEGVLFGLSHLLEDENIVDEYYRKLRTEFQHLKGKFNLEEERVFKPEFYKLRPPNFPTIRLSQVANLYAIHPNLFSEISNASTLAELYSIFEVSASPYWDNHYTFGKPSKKNTKGLTKKFIDLLVVNTILPLKFCYSKYLGKDSHEDVITIISEIHKEENTIITTFKKYGIRAKTAKDSQAIIQLYTEYCTRNKCLQCAIGTRLLQS